MSTLAYSYSEPYKLPAGVLALVVHAAFFALLYFGVNWHNDQPQGMEVDIWSDLPSPQVEPVIVAPPPPSPMPQVEPVKPIAPAKLVEPVEPPKADIEMVVKKKQKAKLQKPLKPVEVKQIPLKITKPIQIKSAVNGQRKVNLTAVTKASTINQAQPIRTEQTLVDQQAMAAQVAKEEQSHAREVQAAAIGKMVDEYKLKIISKIRRNIVMPPDVQDNMQSEFDVILIPGGSVLSTSLTKPSGNSAYDEAVDRAISKAQPLPLPSDVSQFNKFRELHLTFTPKE